MQNRLSQSQGARLFRRRNAGITGKPPVQDREFVRRRIHRGGIAGDQSPVHHQAEQSQTTATFLWLMHVMDSLGLQE
jgi:hypothetical protein